MLKPLMMIALFFMPSSSAADPAFWFGSYSCEDTSPAGKQTWISWSITIEDYYISQRFDGKAEIAGRQILQNLTLRAYLSGENKLAIHGHVSNGGIGPVSKNVDFSKPLFSFIIQGTSIKVQDGQVKSLKCKKTK
jgi:hypothetical protein